jgi:predicted acetyltransferase
VYKDTLRKTNWLPEENLMTTVRRMTEADIEVAARVQSDAFGGVVADRIRRYHEGPRYTWRDGWVVETRGEIGAAAVAFPVTWWLGGTAYTTSAISSVAVRATERRQGLASQMMRAILEAEHQAGRPFSLLYPFQHGFYRRLGYATVGFTDFYRIPLAHLPDDAALRRNVRLVREADREIIRDVYSGSLARLGGLERNAAQWEQRWRTTMHTWVAYDDGAVNGYLAYEQNDSELYLSELVALTPEANRGLWSFLAAQVEQFRVATYHAPAGTPLWATLREPLMFDAPNRGFVLNDAATHTASLMARMVDVPAAFMPRRFDDALSGSFALALHDSVLDANNSAFTITFADGRASAEPTDAEPSARCDIVTFTQIFCGVLRASDARWYGLLHADDATVALLDQAFSGPTPFLHPADWF